MKFCFSIEALKKVIDFWLSFVKRQIVMKSNEDTDKEGETAPALQIAMGYTLLLGTLNTFHFQVSNHEFFVSKHPITVSRVLDISSFDRRVFREVLQFLGSSTFAAFV